PPWFLASLAVNLSLNHQDAKSLRSVGLHPHDFAARALLRISRAAIQPCGAGGSPLVSLSVSPASMSMTPVGTAGSRLWSAIKATISCVSSRAPVWSGRCREASLMPRLHGANPHFVAPTGPAVGDASLARIVGGFARTASIVGFGWLRFGF